MAHVSGLLEAGAWRHVGLHQSPLLSVWDSLSCIPLLRGARGDRVVWTPTPSGDFTLSSAYSRIIEHGAEISWWRVVWFSGHVPRFSFISWMVCHGRLATRDRLAQWGVVQSTRCLLCMDGDESRDHLFFACPYSSVVWRIILRWCLLVHDPGPWMEEICWFSLHCASDGFSSTVRKLALSATLCHLWRERNSRLFHPVQRPPDCIIRTILSDVSGRLAHLVSDIDDLPIHSALCDTWGLSPTFRRPTTSWVRWIPPEEDRIAIHTDASLREDMAGLGCCVRDHRGRFLGGIARGVPRDDSILLHELQAILTGMELALTLGVTRADICSDSLTAIDIIRGICSAPWRTWHITTDICLSSTLFSSVSFRHVQREGNRAADFLTHHCTQLGEIRLEPSSLPVELSRILEADASGIPLCRVR